MQFSNRTRASARDRPGAPDHESELDELRDDKGGPWSTLVARAATWLRATRLGLTVLAVVVGTGAGLGAVGFRWLIFGFTWLATGHEQFGQQGRVGSLHFPFLGMWFLLLIPIVGGALYGPLIYRFAREARGHGVPEVMIAVAENGGRIRPQVSVVKAFASALCIATGGSVGREGPIVQIGSALASGAGQFVRLSESRLRILVACGAAGGISATFNAPITGIFFGFELILKEVSVDALFAIILSSVTADILSQAFFGSAPFFNLIPQHLGLGHDVNYLLVVVLGLLAGLVGVGFKSVLYKIEDGCDWVWGKRPEWLRPVVGGVVLGVVLLALPEMYGVGYPVMDKVLAGKEVLWLIAILLVAKMVATSLTIGIGGSGGVFAPSLFIGAMGGEAFGDLARHLFGASVGPAALYGVVAMGAVFGGATLAPLTAIASVLEMTGQFHLALPVLLAVGLAAGLSRHLSYGTIYTTKLLRRGIDIDRPRPQNALQVLTVANVMQPLVDVASGLSLVRPTSLDADGAGNGWGGVSPLRTVSEPQALLADETLEDALRQLALYGPEGLPVVASDRNHLVGWVTNDDVLNGLARKIAEERSTARAGVRATEQARERSAHRAPRPSMPLAGFELVEVMARTLDHVVGQPLGSVSWPEQWRVVAVGNGRFIEAARADRVLTESDRVLALTPLPADRPLPTNHRVGL
jgi:CIC family chloride channel protein